MALDTGRGGRFALANPETRTKDDNQFISSGSLDTDRRIQQFSDSENELAVNTADFLVETARDAEREQQAMLETTSVDSTYQDYLVEYIETKHEQVERVEDSLERLIEQQQSRMQQGKANKPGIFSSPGTKRQWQVQQTMQLNRLQSLRSRLEMVREIATETGVYGPRIEELAERKLRAEHPDTAKEWDEMCAAQRHQDAIRIKERKSASQSNVPTNGLSLGLSNRH